MLDCLISGGVVVDGTGAALRRADVGICDGRIVLVGVVTKPRTGRSTRMGLSFVQGLSMFTLTRSPRHVGSIGVSFVAQWGYNNIRWKLWILDRSY